MVFEIINRNHLVYRPTNIKKQHTPCSSKWGEGHNLFFHSASIMHRTLSDNFTNELFAYCRLIYNIAVLFSKPRELLWEENMLSTCWTSPFPFDPLADTPGMEDVSAVQLLDRVHG